MIMKEELLRIEHIVKTFGVVKALKDVSFVLERGEIRGLIGENGSGKSTVSSIIAGIQPADSGELFLRGQPYHPTSALDAQKAGISMIVQEIGTLNFISVAHNIFAGREVAFMKGPFVDRKAMEADADEVLTRLGMNHIRGAQPINMLSFEERKLVELARALYNQPEILIVDETTTALSQSGREILYQAMRDTVKRGGSVLFISHDLDELTEVCDVVTVLRDGELIGTVKPGEVSMSEIKQMMVGRQVADNYYRTDYDEAVSDEVVLRAINISSPQTMANFDLELHKGEILGIGGLSNSGMHEIGRMLFGAEPPITGYVELADGSKIRNIRDAILHKLGYVSKNRDEEVLVLRNSIRNNLTASAFHLLKRKGFIGHKSEDTFAQKQIDQLRIKCFGMNQDVGTLSGGNKQKVSFGKWIGNDSQILILDCPTRGVDIGVKATMYQLMYELKQQGISIILISEEMPELIGMSDRLLIIKDGKQTASFMRSRELCEHDIIEYLI